MENYYQKKNLIHYHLVFKGYYKENFFIIYKKLLCVKPNGNYKKFRLVLPIMAGKLIIKYYHNSIENIHDGVSNTYRFIRDNYLIPSARDLCEDIIMKCIPCQLAKGRPTRKPEIKPITANYFLT